MPAHHQRSGPAAFCSPIVAIKAAYNTHDQTIHEFGTDIAQSSSHEHPENREYLPPLLGSRVGMGVQTVVWK